LRRLGFLFAFAVALGGCGGDEPRGTVARIDAERLSASWRPGCPVGPKELRLVTVEHWDFDAKVRRGQLVVHESVADEMVEVFERLYEARFPISRLQPIDAYGGDDDRSMAANNSSGFNCRLVAGTGRWSEHAYGRAVDLNPVQNPYVSAGGRVAPPAGRRFVNRTERKLGMVQAGDEVVRAFAAIGWRWGGSWRGAKDYQHFSASGR
jgi:hypothetical protein